MLAQTSHPAGPGLVAGPFLAFEALIVLRARQYVDFPQTSARFAPCRLDFLAEESVQGALDIIESLAAKHRDVKFIVGRKEDWDEPFWAPQSLKDYCADALTRLSRLGNVQFVSRFEAQVDYWRFLSEIDIAFSCSYHETFGIAMLEKAYAGAACVVPNTVAYPEVHSGAVLVDHFQIASAVDRLIREPEFRTQVAHRSQQNASKYGVSRTVEKLAEVVGGSQRHIATAASQ